MITALDSAAASSALPTPQDLPGCAWWNLACKDGEQAANSGLSAITKSIASGAEMLLGEIVKVIDESSAVPLADPTYQHVYYGFLGLAAPLVGIVLSIALVVASLHRDASTLGRACIGVGVACVGGALYIVFAQLLIGIDDWLSHGVVEVTGYNLSQSITQIAAGFHNIAGTQGEMAANMLLLLLMLVMLVAGMILWFVLVLRKIAILVVVAFAPLLIAGYLWAPTRSWVRKTTEVLIALVFTKTAIFTLFGIGLALLSRGAGQSLSDFVGTTVLMCGACFAPLVMLRLVHFAADSHLAGDAIGTLSGGMRPVTSRLTGNSPTPMSRHDLARQQSSTPRPDGPTPVKAAPLPSPSTATPPAASGSGASAAGAATGGAGLAAGAAIGVASSAKVAAQSAAQGSAQAATRLSPPPDPAGQPLRGPDLPSRDQTDGKDT
jgi:type IV secretion system protein TrbL